TSTQTKIRSLSGEPDLQTGNPALQLDPPDKVVFAEHSALFQNRMFGFWSAS
ncbi:MAG: hypothetical protein ACI9UN_005269, partial [Granulosicoccus sp.]